MKSIVDIIKYFSNKYNGDFKQIRNAIMEKEKITISDVEESVEALNCNTVTVLETTYPYQFKDLLKPPFVIYYYGDLSLINGNTFEIYSDTKYDKNIKYIVSRIVKNYVVVVIGKSVMEAEIIKECMKNDRPFIYINDSNSFYELDNNIQEYIKTKGLVIDERPFENDRGNLRQIGGWSKFALLIDVEVGSKKYNDMTTSMLIGKGVVMCLPSEKLGKSINNILLKDNAVLVECFKDIKEIVDKVTGEL